MLDLAVELVQEAYLRLRLRQSRLHRPLLRMVLVDLLGLLDLPDLSDPLEKELALEWLVLECFLG